VENIKSLDLKHSMMPYYVYIIQCDDSSLYTGYSKNLDKRMKLHLEGKGARYLRTHKPKKLAYVEEFDSRAEAMRRERKIKLLTHSQKLRLAESKFKVKRRVPRSERRRNKFDLKK
jgi:putative endonuclease